MIAFLRGEVVDQTIDRVVLDVRGVGYEVFVPVGTQGKLKPNDDGEVGVYVYTSVREDAIQLFGFHAKDVKRVFEKIITVSGIGPKLGLNVMSALEPAELVRAIESNDIKALTKISGVGKKTAQRLILELKSKIDDVAFDSLSPTAGVGGALIEDLRSALGNLGYNETMIEPILAELGPKAEELGTLDDLLREAFKLMR
jgi:Holliday junction DNA helicase RuvA